MKFALVFAVAAIYSLSGVEAHKSAILGGALHKPPTVGGHHPHGHGDKQQQAQADKGHHHEGRHHGGQEHRPHSRGEKLLPKWRREGADKGDGKAQQQPRHKWVSDRKDGARHGGFGAKLFGGKH